MDKILLYSTGCPKCNVLKRKMEMKNIAYEEISDLNVLQEKGLQSVPYLQVNDGELMDFSAANAWINNK